MLVYLRLPGILRTVMSSLPSRYSMMSVSVARPPTSEKPARMFSTVMMKLNDASGSFLLPAVGIGEPSLGLGFDGLLRDAEDDELRRFHRRDADHADQPSV